VLSKSDVKKMGKREFIKVHDKQKAIAENACKQAGRPCAIYCIYKKGCYEFGTKPMHQQKFFRLTARIMADGYSPSGVYTEKYKQQREIETTEKIGIWKKLAGKLYPPIACKVMIRLTRTRRRARRKNAGVEDRTEL